MTLSYLYTMHFNDIEVPLSSVFSSSPSCWSPFPANCTPPTFMGFLKNQYSTCEKKHAMFVFLILDFLPGFMSAISSQCPKLSSLISSTPS
jgi:hypothetical protein